MSPSPEISSPLLTSKLKPTRIPTYIAFWLLGTINNMSYVVVNSSAKSLAESFHSENLIGVIQWANVSFGIGFKALNTWGGNNYSYRSRILFGLLMCVLGLVGVACSGTTKPAIWT